MDSIICKGLVKDVEFYLPHLSGKDTIKFNDCSLSLNNSQIYFNETHKSIEIQVDKKKFLIKLSQEDNKRLVDLKNKETELFSEYYHRLKTKKEIVVCYFGGDMIFTRTKTAWDKGFAPYWDKMFMYFVGGEISQLKDVYNVGSFNDNIFDILQKTLYISNIEFKKNGNERYFEADFEKFISYLKN